jgi:nucleotide-binding universal stress UspA family protein
MAEELLVHDLPLKIRGEMDSRRARRYLQYLQKIIVRTAFDRSVEKAAPTLLVREPRWPIQKILFIVRGDQRDPAAMEWTVRLARQSAATVTLLVIYPDAPGFYTHYTGIQLDLPVLLQMQEGIGALLRRFIYLLEHSGILYELHLRKAPPNEQIRREVDEGDYDLVIIPGECRGRLWRLRFGEIVGPLLRWIDRPVLAV